MTTDKNAALADLEPFEDIIFRINDYLQKCDATMEEEAFGGKKWTELSKLRLEAYTEKRAVELVRDRYGLELMKATLPALREACHEAEFHDLFTTLHSITITREGPDKVCRKPVSEEAALYVVRTLVMEYPHGLRIKQPPSKEKT